MKANIAILHVGQLQRWKSNIRRKLLVLVVLVLFCTDTVRPRTHSDLIPWAQKIEFESCKYLKKRPDSALLKKNGGIIRLKRIFFETFWANSSGGFEGSETFFGKNHLYLSSFPLSSSLFFFILFLLLSCSFSSLVFSSLLFFRSSLVLSLFLCLSLSLSVSVCLCLCLCVSVSVWCCVLCCEMCCVVLCVWCGVWRGLARRKRIRV